MTWIGDLLSNIFPRKQLTKKEYDDWITDLQRRIADVIAGVTLVSGSTRDVGNPNFASSTQLVLNVMTPLNQASAFLEKIIGIDLKQEQGPTDVPTSLLLPELKKALQEVIAKYKRYEPGRSTPQTRVLEEAIQALRGHMKKAP